MSVCSCPPRKFISTNLLAVILLATFAAAQTNIPQVQHVIIVIQENRGTDNLFGSDAFSKQPQLPGADLAKQGSCYSPATGKTSAIPLVPWPLAACWDTDHSHGGPHHRDAWVTSYRQGNMDGACNVFVYHAKPECSGGVPYFTCPVSGTRFGYCPGYSYVDNSAAGGNVIQPYFQIAKHYGYANYFFQTNQGPSYEAHQFLFSGTSAPVYNDGDPNQYWTWFAAEIGPPTEGCVANPGTIIPQIDPFGTESPGYNNGYPCYNHNTLADVLDQNRITWKYYPYKRSFEIGLWTAPNSIQNICGPSGGKCEGAEWKSNVAANVPPFPRQKNKMAPILSDIENCNLPAVSWVIPNGSWSDHLGGGSNFLGPAWVAAIVNAVGRASCVTGEVYWKDTVILITWDDWGGLYDHVLPWRCQSGPNGNCQGYSDGSGQQYVYGFRVPLLVVSAYAKQGYISGALPPYGPGEVVPYVHDFGSILNFIEYAFGHGGKSIGEISPTYHYADYWAPDAPTSGNCVPSTCPYSLSDFFNFSGQPRTFKRVTLPISLRKYDAEYFENFGLHAGDPEPSDPDDDAIEALDD